MAGIPPALQPADSTGIRIMDLLDVARGPVLKVALASVLGTLWRLFGILRLPGRPDRSPAREGAPGRARGALRAVARGFWPRQAFAQVAVLATINSWIFHLALALVCLGYGRRTLPSSGASPDWGGLPCPMR